MVSPTAREIASHATLHPAVPQARLPRTYADADLFVGRERLVAEEQHLVLEECAADLAIRGVVDAVREIDAAYLGTERGREAPHLDPPIGFAGLARVRGRRFARGCHGMPSLCTE